MTTKEIILAATMALTLIWCSGCDNKNTKQENAAEGAESNTEANAPSAAPDTQLAADANFITYTNDAFGYSIDVPRVMTRDTNFPMEEGASFDMGDESYNQLLVLASDNYGGKPYTQEQVKAEYDEFVEGSFSDVPSDKLKAELGKMSWTITVNTDDEGQQISMARFVGSRKYELTLTLGKDYKQQLGDQALEHITQSWNIKQ